MVAKAKWPRKRLEELAEFRNGVNYNKSSFGEGVKVVGVSDFQDYSKPRYDELEQINPEGIVTARNILRDGDIVFVRSNGNRELIGRSLFIEQPPEEITHSAFTIRLRFTTREVHPKFYAYCFRSPLIRQALTAQGSGTNINNLNQDILNALEVPFPPLPMQRRIASILSAYDELIENSQRRIRILEKMAHALYREWFVHFRFPGHEKLRRAASPLGDIPQGWKVKEMQEVADVIDCLHSKKPAESVDGPGALLQLNNIGEGGKLDMREQFRISAEDYRLWTSRIELLPGDCVVTNVGRVGAVAQIPEGVKIAPGRNMTAIRARDGELTPTCLIEYLLSSHMESEIAKKKDLGTIMDSLNVKGIIRLHMPCPPLETMQRFENVARPIRRRIELLVEQIQNLRRTRDLLLPRLLSGQTEVEPEKR